MMLLRWMMSVCLAFLVAISANAQDKKKPLAIEDLYLMESMRAPALFAKEEKLVYERVWIDPKTKEERHSLWLVTEKSDNRKPFEAGEPDGRSPVVSPDGRWIAFLSTRPRPAGWKPIPPTPAYSDPGVDIWLYHVKTGKVMPLGGPDKEYGRVLHDGFYGRVAFSPNSGQLIFVADLGQDPRTKQEIENKVQIVRPDQGEGYTGYGPARIWLADLLLQPDDFAGRNIELVTKGADQIWYGDPQWSPDGKKLVVVANKTKDRESARFNINKNFDLFLIDLADGNKQTQLTTNPGADVSPRWSPDGNQIAYLSIPRIGPHRDVFNLSMLTLTDGKPNIRTLVDIQEPNMKGEFFAPSFPLLDDPWGLSERYMHFSYEQGTRSFRRFLYTHGGSSVRQTMPNRTDSRTDSRKAELVPWRNRVLEERLEGESSTFTWKNEGFDVEGILTTPPAEVAKPPYKLIVYPHGGPHSRSTIGFDFTVQLFAAHGYAVFQPNFRGSTGYGKKFLDADRLDLGGGDMRDILTGIDQLMKDGKVDPKRQFVYGISYGGFMTSWLVGQTRQFKAAAAQNAVTDMNMMYSLSDLPSWTVWELGGLPWEQPERYRKHSPLTYANKVKTPTLILHARDDRRCPLPMGQAYHQALLANNVPTQLVIYPNEGHGIRSPRHREDVYRRVLDWFAKHDK